MIWAVVAAAIVVVNLVTFVRFGADKARAVAGQRRIPESDLLWWAAIGGTPAAFAACRHFRHKTRKQPFGTRLQLIAMVQAGVLGGLMIAMW